VAICFFDAEADTLLLSFEPAAETVGVTAESREWGAVVRELEFGRAVSAEIWSASQLFPRLLLDAVPRPTDTAAEHTADLGYFDRDTGLLWFRADQSTCVELRAAAQTLAGDLLDLFGSGRP
jgi:hypothetical protein